MEKSNKPMANRRKTLRGTRKTLCVVLLVVVVAVVWWEQSRSFYCFSDAKCITIWKRSNGFCYIILGKYYGLFRPSDAYIKTSNDNALTIIVDDRTGYVIANDYGGEVRLKLSGQQVKFYNYDERDVFVDKYYKNGKLVNEHNYLKIDVKENLVVVNGVKQ